MLYETAKKFFASQTARFASVLIVSLSFLISACIPAQPHPAIKSLSQSDDDRIEPEDPEQPRRRRRRRSRGGGGGNPPEPETPEPPDPEPPVNTACPERNPPSSRKLADITFQTNDDGIVVYSYIHSSYRYARDDDGIGGGDPRDWGESSPDQNILLRLHDVDSEYDSGYWVTLNEDRIRSVSGKAWYIYIDGSRHTLRLTSYPGKYTVDGTKHIVFETGDLSLYQFRNNSFTVHIAEGTADQCSYYRP